jgi:hypothetical protein
MSINKSNITAGFIDLATYDELEKYLYGCSTSVSYFVRTTVKSTWFTQLPVILPVSKGTAGFGQDFAVNISRSGDYLLNMWMRVGIPVVTATHPAGAGNRVRWTQNLMHNLIKKVSITFNDMVVEEFDNYNLDMWTAFIVPSSKQDGYNNMIGQTADLINLTDLYLTAVAPGLSKQLPPAYINPGISVAVNTSNNNVLTSGQIEETFLNLPLPFFFSRDSGVALPTAALPYNEMTVHFSFRDWNELLIAEKGSVLVGANVVANTNGKGEEYRSIPTVGGEGDILSTPVIKTVEVWANYAIVSNDERKRMACAPRDILIEQFQSALPVRYTPQSAPNPNIDLRLSHAIKVIFFAVQNITFENERSVYTVGSPAWGGLSQISYKFSGQFMVDPIESASLVYENTERLSNMGQDYYSYVNPYYTAVHVPAVNGYHCYSYSLDFNSLDPMGSTNYGKLTHVSIRPKASALAIAANTNKTASDITDLTLPMGGDNAADKSVGGANGSGVNIQQKYQFILNCVNHNIVRVSGGTLGFPVL